MVSVGVFVRAESGALGEVASRLAALEGVSTFELEDPGAIGVLLQERDIHRAYAKLRDEVQQVEGVLAAWPIHTVLDAHEQRAAQDAGV